MKSPKTYFVAAVAMTALLVCSFAVAGEIEGPVMKGEVNHTISRAMREYAARRSWTVDLCPNAPSSAARRAALVAQIPMPAMAPTSVSPAR